MTPADCRPTLTLLGKTVAPVIVAIFRTLFARDTLPAWHIPPLP